MPATRVSRPRRSRALLPVGGLVLLLAAVALPTLAAGPGASPGDAPAVQPAQAEQPPDPGRGPKEKKAKVAKAPITISGTVSATTDDNGRREYRMSSGGTSYLLDGGPSWFYGEDHPLEKHVGKSVTIVGEVAEGATEVDVVTVDGTALREPGRPPWAGGWQRVGADHPGWSQEKADRMADKLERRKAKFGDCFPPGLCKQDEPAD